MFKKHSFQWFIFLSSLAKGLLGVFNAIYLYKIGFSVQDVMFWYFLLYLGHVIFMPISFHVGTKLGFKKIVPFSALFFFISYFYLACFVKDMTGLIIYSILFSLYSSCYWMPRHQFEFQDFTDTKVGSKVGILLIVTQLASLFSGLVSAFFLDYFPFIVLVIVSTVIFVTSLIPLFFIKENDSREKGSVIEYLKMVPKTTLFHIFLKEGKTPLDELFALYMFIYVSSSYGFVGVVNFLLGIASIIFTYFISRKLDKKRERYLLSSIVLLCLVYILKINITSSLIFAVILGEGLIKQFYSSVSNSNYYYLGKKLKTSSYIVGNEVFINIARCVIFFVGFFLLKTLPKFIYFCIGLMILSGFVPFTKEECIE